jgi:hypothetical protein
MQPAELATGNDGLGDACEIGGVVGHRVRLRDDHGRLGGGRD